MRTRDLISAARRMGREDASRAASWAWDGNTSRETAERIVQMLEDGDPEVYDLFAAPNLSGEYAGDPTPQGLARDLGLEDDDPRSEWLVDELASAYEDAVSSVFWPAVERAYRAILTA